MRTSTPRAPRRNTQLPVKTIDVFKQPKPITFTNMGYCMSTPAPLHDPCAYAASVSGPNIPTRPANRITQSLEPTFVETEAKKGENWCTSRSTAGDPALMLAEQHDLESYKAQMLVAGVPAEQYMSRQPSRSMPIRGEMGDASVMGDTTAETVLNTTTMLVTPLRRPFEGPQGSTAKRQRVSTDTEGDLSSDTVKSVLRLVDESLVDTPERKAITTPKVMRAVPGPSPKEQGPTYAYSSESRIDQFGGLLPRAASVLAPFSVTRI